MGHVAVDDETYTIEVRDGGEWHLVWKGQGLTEAVNRFRHYLMNEDAPFRMTSAGSGE